MIVQFVSCNLRWCSRDSSCLILSVVTVRMVTRENKNFYFWVWLIVNLPKSDFEGPNFSLQARILIQRWVTRELAWREFLKINIFRHIEIIIFEPSPGGLTTSRWSTSPVWHRYRLTGWGPYQSLINPYQYHAVINFLSYWLSQLDYYGMKCNEIKERIGTVDDLSVSKLPTRKMQPFPCGRVF